MLKCPSCTQEVTARDEACPSCGASLEESHAPTRILGEPGAPSSGQDAARSRRATLNTAHTTAGGDSIDDARFVSGTVLAGRYRIVGLLGRGGMGEVYRADDLKLKQPVALKFLPEHVSNDPASLARFYQEVSFARQVSHRNVCRVYDIGEANGQHFLSMEFVRGEELASVLKRFGRLPADKAVDIARQLCAGLHAVHERGVLHRDLKPANVMIDENGNVRLTDFGLAALAEELGGERGRAGTPAYMSPEQLAGKELTARSDIYSLGLVLYEVFTGRRAFEAPTLPKMLELRKSLTAPTSPSDLVKDLDPLVERVVERCLETDPEKRPATALQVAAALPGGDPLQAALAAGETPSPEMVAAAPKEGVLRPSVALACLAALVVGLALVVLLSSRFSLHGRVALDKSPEALKERARDLAGKLGYSETPTDTAYGFSYNQSYLQHVRDKDHSAGRWDKLATQQPKAMSFWYRQSPRYLVPVHQDEVRVQPEDPPPLVSNMLTLWLDPQGRLVGLLAVPPQVEEHAGDTTAFDPNSRVMVMTLDWNGLFAEAGLNPSDFRQTAPKWVPLVESDVRMAWEGTFPNQPEPTVRVEAAAYQGRPVYFQIVGPWSRPERMQQLQPTANEKAAEVIGVLMFVVVLVAAAFIARRNWKLGRGDMRGASRLALYVFTVSMLYWVLRTSHVPMLSEEVFLFLRGFQLALLPASLIWLFYLALEPYVRRWWPHRIIAWKRLLNGDFRDPLVGRDLLIGGLFGVCAALVGYARRPVAEWLGMPSAVPAAVNISTFDGVRSALGEFFFFGMMLAVYSGLLSFFVFFLLRLILRKTWLAAGVFWLLVTVSWGLRGGAVPPGVLLLDLATGGLLALALILMLTRFGLLAVIAAQFFIHLCTSYPLTTDLTAWYADSGLLALALALAFAVYGFHTSLAGRPLFRGRLLEE